MDGLLARFVERNEQFEMQARTWASNESVMTFGAGGVWGNVAKRCTEQGFDDLIDVDY